MLRLKQITILACDMLADLRGMKRELLENSFSPDIIINWATVEVAQKMGAMPLGSDTSDIVQLLAKIPQYFNLPALDFPSVHIQYWQYIKPPTVKAANGVLVINPPTETVNGATITPESVKVFRVLESRLVEIAQYFTKGDLVEIKCPVEAGLYCVVAHNINGYGIPARNVEVK